MFFTLFCVNSLEMSQLPKCRHLELLKIVRVFKTLYGTNGYDVGYRGILYLSVGVAGDNMRDTSMLKGMMIRHLNSILNILCFFICTYIPHFPSIPFNSTWLWCPSGVCNENTFVFLLFLIPLLVDVVGLSAPLTSLQVALSWEVQLMPWREGVPSRETLTDLRSGPMFNKAKSVSVQVWWKWTESSFADKDLRILVDERLDRSWQCALRAQKPDCILGCIQSSVASREVVLSLLFLWDSTQGAASSSGVPNKWEKYRPARLGLKEGCGSDLRLLQKRAESTQFSSEETLWCHFNI